MANHRHLVKESVIHPSELCKAIKAAFLKNLQDVEKFSGYIHEVEEAISEHSRRYGPRLVKSINAEVKGFESEKPGCRSWLCCLTWAS